MTRQPRENYWVYKMFGLAQSIDYAARFRHHNSKNPTHWHMCRRAELTQLQKNKIAEV